MIKNLLIFLALVSIGSYLLYPSSTSNVDELFNKFVQEHRRSYFSKDEYNYRLGVFTENLKEIEEMNANPNDQAVYGINLFADWTNEEFMKLNGLKASENEENVERVGRDVTLRGNVDWTEKTQPIKNQGACGSCWAFAAVGVHEAAWNIRFNQLFDLSEQQLVDCAGIQFLNFGCNGGMYNRAWNYVKSFGGLNSQENYPYQAVDQKCAAKKDDKNAPIKGSTAIKQTAEYLKAEIDLRPIAVGVDATEWKYYTEGISNPCGAEYQMNHAVVAVGYTSEYWLIRNSWSTRWGEKGYIRLAMGNSCGIEDNAYTLNILS